MGKIQRFSAQDTDDLVARLATAGVKAAVLLTSRMINPDGSVKHTETGEPRNYDTKFTYVNLVS